ncbi:unknown protein [Seminavis robusta]|uniref:Uncharacterized protein n=1 Tax=Seminavis robusta TaxID=568900 RepID=A0A9N8EUP4_9STRA|nr:unknown protein [Seminavis robusta]|eukprot:Sro1736_g294390.1 n/a (431) ;mRNA; f:10995-12287
MEPNQDPPTPGNGEPVPVQDPVKNDDCVVQHMSIEQYQQDCTFCEFVWAKLGRMGFDVLQYARDKILRVNAERLKEGKKKLGEFIYAYDVCGMWVVKYVDKDGNRSPFPPINGTLDMDFLNRLLKMKIILPDPFVEHKTTTMFCDAFGINETNFMHAYHRYLDDVDLYSEGLHDQFGSDEDSDPITATLNRIDNLPTGSPTGSLTGSLTGSSTGSPTAGTLTSEETRPTFHREPLFGYPVYCVPCAQSPTSGSSSTGATSSPEVSLTVASGSSGSQDEILLRPKKWVLSQQQASDDSSSSEEDDDDDDSQETEGPKEESKEEESTEDDIQEEEDNEEDDIQEDDEAEEDDIQEDDEEEDDDDESPKKKQKTGDSNDDDKEEEEEDEEVDTVDGNEDNGSEDNGDEDNGDGAGATVGSLGCVLLSTGSWSY